MSNQRKHGSQFSAERYDAGTGHGDIEGVYQDVWEPRNIISVEPDDVYDNYAADKHIHQVIDYCGIDYLIDPLDGPVYGVNHREHTATDSTLRFDIRADTGTEAPSELDKILDAVGSLTIAPRYASRLKRTADGGVEWVRIVELRELALAIDEGGLCPHKRWDDGDVTAWMFNYDLLGQMDVVVYDSTGEVSE